MIFLFIYRILEVFFIAIFTVQTKVSNYIFTVLSSYLIYVWQQKMGLNYLT